MLVRMSVNVIAMTMWVGMNFPRHSATGRKRSGDPLEHASQIEHAEENQHQAYGKLHRESDTRGNHPAEQKDSASDQQDREGVAHSPKRANQRGMADLSISGNDGCDGNHMVRIGRVPHPEKESQRDNGEQ